MLYLSLLSILQDILENDDIQLDSSFKFSLTMDLVKVKLNIERRQRSLNQSATENCDVVCKNVLYCGTHIKGPYQTVRIMRGV